jgi:hypothetical protein
MEQQRPSVKVAFPVGETGLSPLPEYLDAERISKREHFLIINPFNPGMAITRVPAESLTFETLSGGFIVDRQDMINKENRGPLAIKKQQQLSQISEDFWPVAAQTFHRLLVMPKRDHGIEPNITPQMGLTVAPPKRKIDSPKVTRKLGPPTAGGR